MVRVPVTLNPVKESMLSFKAGGRISRVLVELGAFVKAGTIIAGLDETDLGNQIKQATAALAVAEASYANLKAGSRPETIAISRAQLQQAEANLAAQKSNYERMKSLYDEKLISQQQYEAATAAYQAALAQVKVAQESLTLAETGPSAEKLRAAEAQVQQARVAKEIAEDQRQNMYIIGPVQRLRHHGQGQRGGDGLARPAPDRSGGPEQFPRLRLRRAGLWRSNSGKARKLQIACNWTRRR